MVADLSFPSSFDHGGGSGTASLGPLPLIPSAPKKKQGVWPGLAFRGYNMTPRPHFRDQDFGAFLLPRCPQPKWPPSSVVAWLNSSRSRASGRDQSTKARARSSRTGFVNCHEPGLLTERPSCLPGWSHSQPLCTWEAHEAYTVA